MKRGRIMPRKILFGERVENLAGKVQRQEHRARDQRTVLVDDAEYHPRNLSVSAQRVELDRIQAREDRQQTHCADAERVPEVARVQADAVDALPNGAQEQEHKRQSERLGQNGGVRPRIRLQHEQI